MYILIVARNFPKENEPLQGIFEFDQAKALQNYGHKIVYVSLDLRSIRRKRKLGKYWTKAGEIDIVNVSIPLGKIPKSIRYFTGKLALKWIAREILTKHGKPDIIHAHFSGIGYMASVLKNNYKIPLVITEHSSKITQNKPSRNSLNYGKLVYSKADEIIAVSSLLAKNLKKHWGINANIIHNVVDTSSFHFSPKQKSNDFNFISIGNLIKRKGFDNLIDAFKKAGFPANVKLKIIGKGPELSPLQKKIDALGLKNQIELLGFLNRKEISEVMQKSDAFVLASRSETFGVVYIEAMLAGLPVIATACGGPEDFVTPENGLLVPVDNVIELKEALIKIHDEIDIYDKRAISENCKRNFSPENIAGQLTKIYREILNNGKK